MDDPSGLDRLATVATQEMNRLARSQDIRDHNDAVSAAVGGFNEKTAWASWQKTAFKVTFGTIAPVGVVDGVGHDVRSSFVSGVIKINTQHSDWASRWEPERKVGQRLIGYTANVAAAHYIVSRDQNQPESVGAILEHEVKVAAMLESAILIRFDKINMGVRT